MKKKILGVFLILAMMFTIVACNSGKKSELPPIRILAWRTGDPYSMAYLLAEHIKRDTNYKVEVTDVLSGSAGSTQLGIQGQTDIFIGYTTSTYTVVMELDPDEKDLEWGVLHEKTIPWLNSKGIYVSPLIGYNSSFGTLVRKDFGEQYNIKTHADLLRPDVLPKIRMGIDMDYLYRGGMSTWGHIASVYGLEKVPYDEVTLELLIAGLANDQINVAGGGGNIDLAYDFPAFQLPDEKQAYLPYPTAWYVRQEVLDKYPGLKELIDSYAGKFDRENSMIRQLNEDYYADLDHIPDTMNRWLDKLFN